MAVGGVQEVGVGQYKNLRSAQGGRITYFQLGEEYFIRLTPGEKGHLEGALE